MKSVRFWGIAVSLLLLLSLVSCTGIPQQEYARVTSELTKAQAEASSLKTDRDAVNKELGEIKAEIEKLKADVAAQRTINASLTDDLKKLSSPRHFQTLTELNDWLRKDNTDIEYAFESYGNQAFILQIRALRDGYLLPVYAYTDASSVYFGNTAFIDGEIYNVYAEDDYIEFYDYGTILASQPLPSE